MIPMIHPTERGARRFVRDAKKILKTDSLRYGAVHDGHLWVGNSYLAFAVDPRLFLLAPEARAWAPLHDEGPAWAQRHLAAVPCPLDGVNMPTEAGSPLTDTRVIYCGIPAHGPTRLLVENEAGSGGAVTGAAQGIDNRYYEFLVSYYGHNISAVSWPKPGPVTADQAPQLVIQWRAEGRLVAICMPHRLREIPSFAYSSDNGSIAVGVTP